MAKRDVIKALEDPKMVQALRDAGYRVSRPTEEMITKSFKLPRTVAEEFYQKVGREGCLVQEAIEEALIDWIRKK